MKEEALKLADLMIDVTDCETSEFYRAGQMIRRLVERIEELENPIMQAIGTAFAKPLSDEEIDEILDRLLDEDEGHSYHDFARAIEERHGIYVQEA